KVVGDKRIGDRIFFQGGVTNNRSVVAAFEAITGKAMIIPPHFDVTGAIGAAILARNTMQEGQETRFRGFHVSSAGYKVDNFTCRECTNECEIQRVRVEGQKKALYYGGRCEKYEKEERKGQGKDIPNYFEERLSFLMDDYREEAVDDRPTIGIPRSLMLFYQEFPFWNAFFSELGFRVIVSAPSDQKLVKHSIEVMVSETCLPVELAHGHVLDLIHKKADYIFVPFIVNAKAGKDNPTNNPNCPWIQTYPFMVRAAFKDEAIREKLLIPSLHFRFGNRVIGEELGRFMSERFRISRSRTLKALKKARARQEAFEARVRERGRDVLSSLPEDKRAVVLLGRPYNTSDPYLNLRLVEKLISKNTIPIPLDYLPLEEENIFEDYHMMYWPNGQRILAGTRIIAKTRQLCAVYTGNFRCGPDSFIAHFVREEMGNKPWLHLEVDEHSADAGLITRVEAFLDSLEGYNRVTMEPLTKERSVPKSVSKLEGRRLYFPYARDTVHALAAAARHCGVDSEVLPMAGPEDVRLARKYTNGQECFPLICTTGSFIKKILEPGADQSKIAFFMPDHNGPCRFGEYNKLHRILFDRLGFSKVEIITPSNDNSYAELVPGKAGKFRLNAWKGIVAIDILKKLLQERKPYEMIHGMTRQVYDFWLNEVILSVAAGSKKLAETIEAAGQAFSQIPLKNGKRKPLIAILGETFMRDNPYCSGFIVDKLEALGAETIMGPFSEWPVYSTYRYKRDSLWKRDPGGLIGAALQKAGQRYTSAALWKNVLHLVDAGTEVELEEMFKHSEPYIHKDYDGDPVIAIGSASKLAEAGVDGIVYILPFTCMPGTLVASLSTDIRNDHFGIPWENVAFDGQEDASLDIRLQAFMHQAGEYAKNREQRARQLK
ncbi:MAG TPA: acyl-CoA dehydratase activase-related protein, partial [Bacteroidales bacterium]|nr:acyl-CoA dehydratase activase-related protein [Bacteroidales bacterium]